MELKLNIYNKDRTIEKTYIGNDYAVMMGVCEDLLEALDLEALTGSDRGDMIAAAMRLIRSRKDVVYPLLKDIFDGLTDDEIRRTTLVEIAGVIVAVAKRTMQELRELAFRN